MNNTTGYPAIVPPYSKIDLIAWCSAYGVLATLIIAGNGIAIAVLTRKRFLRKRTSYFLLSLAIADMLVGCLSVPLHIVQLSYSLRGMYMQPTTFYRIMRSSDVFCSLASTFTLTIIALERVFAITFPLQHRVTTKRIYHVLVCSVWVLSLMLSSMYFLHTYRILHHQVFFYFMMITFFLSLLVMLIAYLAIWFKVRKTLHSWEGKAQQASVTTTDSFVDSKNAQEQVMMVKPSKHRENNEQSNDPDNVPPTRAIKKDSRGTSGQTKNTSGRRGAVIDKKLAVTLFIVTAVFVVTWLPFQIINMFIFFACKKLPCPYMPPLYAIHFFKLLNYCNSFINPVVYSLRLPEFRSVLCNNVFKRCSQ